MGKRVVLLGAGHAHLHVARHAATFTERGHELLVVAPGPFWYSGLATGMLGGDYPPELDQVDVASLVTSTGGRFIQGSAVRVDPASRLVHLEAGEPVSYDVLSVNLGSEPPDIPGDDGERVYRVKPIRRLAALRADLEAAVATNPGEPLRVVVAGAGVTGCELAGNILGLAAARGGIIDLTVLASSGSVLNRLPDRAARMVEDNLTRRGATVRRHARVARIDPDCAVLESGDCVAFDFFVNAAGLRPNHRIREVGVPVDEQGAMIVDANLRSVGDPAIHGGGDCVAFLNRHLPRIGVYAIRQAPILCHNLLAGAEDRQPREFSPQSKYLWIMNLGDGTGLVTRGSLWWHGRSAYRLKDWIDRRFLRGYQRRAIRVRS